MTGKPTNRILICDSCLRNSDAPPFAQDIDALRRALDGAGLHDQFEVAGAGCFGGCSDPSGFAVQGHGRASYVFSGVTVSSDLDDIIRFCRLYLKTGDGWIIDARPIGRLRHCLRARIPVF